MDEKENAEAVRLVCRGNPLAVQFLEDITEILHLWDDLIDRDKPLQDAAINRTMWKALINLPRNQFYSANFLFLNGLLMTAIINWELATTMERTQVDDNDLPIAFILRSSYVDLVTGVALIVGGREHALEMMLTARRLWHNEGLYGYRKALAQEQTVRGE